MGSLYDINRIENVHGRVSKYVLDPTACTVIEAKQCRMDNIAYLTCGDDGKIYIKSEKPKKIKGVYAYALSSDSRCDDDIPVSFDEDFGEYYFDPKGFNGNILVEIEFHIFCL